MELRGLNACLLFACVSAAGALAQNRYTDTILVANDPAYAPLRFVDPLLGNGWGLALRPPGAGGHFWISNFNTGTTTTYVGDVTGPNGFTPLYQDSLTVVNIPVAGTIRLDRPVAPVPQPTGQVYNYSTTDFVVSGEGVTGASKFIFVTGEGTISGWTEVRDAQGVLHRQTSAVLTVDQSQDYDDDRLRFTGCAVTDFASDNRLFVTNLTENRVEVYDSAWQRLSIPVDRFRFPGQIADGFRPWNIQYFHTGANGEGRLWVVYIKLDDPWEEDPAFGAVAEFDLDGNFIRRFTTSLDTDPFADSELRGPWGLAIAPSSFGSLAGKMLVSNFSDGTIAAFDLASGAFSDFVRGDDGSPLIVDGIWGIAFGNGVGLGDSNALYYAAGPNSEQDGTFGTIRHTPTTCGRFVQQPTDANLCSGETVTISIDANGPARFSVYWRMNGAVIHDGTTPDGSLISGANSSTLLIMNAASSDSGSYTAALSNACGDVVSRAANVVVAPRPRGDLDLDGDVDLSDLATLLANFGEADGATRTHGDLDLDGDVDLSDLSALLATFGERCGQ